MPGKKIRPGNSSSVEKAFDLYKSIQYLCLICATARIAVYAWKGNVYFRARIKTTLFSPGNRSFPFTYIARVVCASNVKPGGQRQALRWMLTRKIYVFEAGLFWG